MSDSEDDAPGAALPRQKSIFSTMNRVRNMNHLREKWTARSKLSSSSGSTELETSASSAVSLSNKKRVSTASVSQPADATTTPSVAISNTAVPPSMTPIETQRFATLGAWMQRFGLTVPPTASNGDAFDTLYASLDEMEAAVKRELSLLWPSHWSPATEHLPPRGLHVSSLVDYMVVIGPDVADLATSTYWFAQEDVFEATVVFAHPPQAQFNAECIEQFCFPRGVHTSSVDTPAAADEFFVLVLSGGGDQGQSVQYACCLRTQIAVGSYGVGNAAATGRMVSVCYVVVVSVPWIPFYHQLLSHLAARHQEELTNVKSDEIQSTIVPDALVQHIDSMMSALATMELPARGLELCFTFPPDAVFACLRPRIDSGAPETVTLLLEWAARLLLSVLSIERVIMVIGLLLVEMKVIVVSKSLPLLSAGTVGLAALLYPLAWAGPLISILPPALHEYLEAPVPLLCGVDVLPDQFILTKGTAILYMDRDEIQLHPDDTAQIGGLQFPGSGELAHQLCAFSDRLLAVSASDQSRVVVANFVVRRMRRQLLDLLQLCARVNPCNAYACVKQEQLSLPETSFLKTFMQSQMYQKYSDDQSQSEHPKKINTPDEWPTEIKGMEVDASNPVASLSTPLASSIRDLFMLAMTGSCSFMENTPPPLKEAHLVTNELDMEIQDGDGCKEGYAEQLSVKSTHSNHSTSQDHSPVDNPPRQERDQEGSDICTENALRAEANTEISSMLNTLNLTEPAHLLMFSPHKRDSFSARGSAEVYHSQSHSTPASPTKPLGMKEPHVQVAFPPSARRSMPDVLADAEGRKSFVQADTEHLVSMANSTSESSALSAGDDHAQIRSREFARGSRQQDMLTHVSHLVAATLIQAAWRKYRQTKRTVSFTPLSLASGRSASDTTIPTTMGDWTPTKLRFGTSLCMHTEHDKLIDIRVRLGADGSDLQWYHGDQLHGCIALADVHEVQARDGTIVIHSSSNVQVTFIVTPHGASTVMSFFQGLHRLATSTSTGLPSPTPSTKSKSSEQTNPTPAISRQESVRGEPVRHESVRGETATTIKETSTQERRRTVIDIETGASSFLTFDDIMRRGILVLKHGRMGRPHPKFLVCDDAMQVLSWIDPAITNAGFQPPTQPTIRVDQKSIRFHDMTDLLRGKRTKVLQRSTANRSNAELCFSIVTRTRTLDIEAFSLEDVALLVEGIEQRVAVRRSSRN